MDEAVVVAKCSDDRWPGAPPRAAARIANFLSRVPALGANSRPSVLGFAGRGRLLYTDDGAKPEPGEPTHHHAIQDHDHRRTQGQS